MNPCGTRLIASGWRYKARDQTVLDVSNEVEIESGWVEATQFPSEIHAELLAAGVITHPYKVESDTDLQWINDSEWLYFTTFPYDVTSDHAHVELLFEGLDTYCTVYLNGNKILEADNMLLPRTVTLTGEYPLKAKNQLLLYFKSAKAVAKELEATYGVVRAGSCNVGDPSRVYSRKAQYHWRWDWGPELMSVGPWRPIYLGTYDLKINSLALATSVDQELRMSLGGYIMLSGASEHEVSMSAVLSCNGLRQIVREEKRGLSSSELTVGEVELSWTFKDDEVELWWPVRYGSQSLYTVEVTIFSKTGDVLDRTTQQVGFRRVQLIQEELVDAEGTTFLFEINNQRIFMGGSNWVPADNMLTTIGAERYHKYLEAIIDGNQNMVRVWSGGIYEPDAFYATCDELGILVWQDFCGFACGVYPAHPSYIKQVTAEAEANVLSLRHHPSIVIWCGNNEDYQQIKQWNLEPKLPARIFYEGIFPGIITKLSPGTVYWPGSPFGGKEWHETEDLTVGDVHEWHVWPIGKGGEYYQNYDLLGGRFVSEFGLPSLPNIKTIDYWLHDADSAQRHPQSKLMAQHCRAGSFERRFANYMNENFRMTGDLETYTYLTQLMQAEGLGHAYRSWRREWRGPGKQYTAGALVWQLNDSWPATSWSLIDYFMRKKPAYYVIARELRPIAVGIMRKVEKDRHNDRPRQFYEFGAFRNKSASIEIWVSNFTLMPVVAKLEISYWDLDRGSFFHVETRDVILLSNQTTEVMAGPLLSAPGLRTPALGIQRPVELDRSHTVVVHARLLDASGEVIARTTNWPEPLKHIDPVANPGLQVTVEGEMVTITAEKPIKGLFFDTEGEEDGQEVKWSDNAIDVLPGDTQTLQVQGLNKARITAAYLGRETARVL
ncbi:hypothetical protein FRB94_003614 [Tulasnella sp. JGI-2019a]|nr:hypothetical protein FRB94_003614 [Tulasnella sp. JGI-2019a]